MPFGVGMGLTLDESALLLELDDVYWSEEGILSVQIALAVAAMLAAVALAGRFLRRGEQVVLEHEPATARDRVAAMDDSEDKGPQSPAPGPFGPGSPGYGPGGDQPEEPSTPPPPQAPAPPPRRRLRAAVAGAERLPAASAAARPGEPA